MKIIYKNTKNVVVVSNWYGETVYRQEPNNDLSNHIISMTTLGEIRTLVQDGHTKLTVDVIEDSSNEVVDIELDEGEVIVYTTSNTFQGVFTSFQAAKRELEYGATSSLEREQRGIPTCVLVVDEDSYPFKNDPSTLAMFVPASRYSHTPIECLRVVKVDGFCWSEMDYDA